MQFGGWAWDTSEYSDYTLKIRVEGKCRRSNGETCEQILLKLGE
jgi:hypothetical protein